MLHKENQVIQSLDEVHSKGFHLFTTNDGGCIVHSLVDDPFMICALPGETGNVGICEAKYLEIN